MKACLLVVFAVALLYPVVGAVEAGPIYASDGSLLPFKPLSEDESGIMREGLDAYSANAASLPGFAKGFLDGEVTRVHVRLPGGRIAVAGMRTDRAFLDVLGTLDAKEEHLIEGGNTLKRGDETISFTSALYVGQDAVEKIAASRNPQGEFARQWGSGVQYRGLTFTSGIKALLLNVGMFLQSLASPAPAQPTECPAAQNPPDQCEGAQDDLVAYYPAPGEDFKFLCDYIDGITPYSPHWAQTSCGYFYPLCKHYETKVVESCGCECTATFGEPLIEPDIKKDFPEWTGPGHENSTAGQKAEWNRFMAKLRNHEDGHEKIFRDGAAKAEAKLRQLKATAAGKQCSAACNKAGKQLLDAANAVRAQVKKEVNSQTGEYDAQTKNGATQEAVLDCSID